MRLFIWSARADLVAVVTPAHRYGEWGQEQEQEQEQEPWAGVVGREVVEGGIISWQGGRESGEELCLLLPSECVQSAFPVMSNWISVSHLCM